MTVSKLTEATHTEKRRILDAALYARHLLPGPIGEMTYRELVAWAEFGYRLGHDRVVMQVVDWAHTEWRLRKEKTA